MEQQFFYQVIIINRNHGISSILPDNSIYKNEEDAIVDAHRKINFFNEQQEELTYIGVISTLEDIANIYRNHDTDNVNEVYVYKIKVKSFEK